MRIHWGFKEEILILLAKAAKAPDQSEEQTLLLNEASVLLWRFDNEVLPRSADCIRNLLAFDINVWLPRTVNLMYTGPLICKGQPTMLSDIILLDLSEDSLSLRDRVINDALVAGRKDDYSFENFRELYNAFTFPGLIKPEEIKPLSLKSRFYTKIPTTQHDDYIYSCPGCLSPLDHIADFLQCSSPFCPTTKYSRLPPHGEIPYHTRKAHITKTVYKKQMKLNQLAWRTIASPIVFEKTIMKYLKKVLPASTSETITLNESRPGLSIIESGNRVNFDPVATHSAPTIFSYYSEKSIPGETWIVVPDGTRQLFQHLKEKLSDNYKIVTARSYPYEYLKKFHSGRTRVKRVRCR